jgi:hypothetical protein
MSEPRRLLEDGGSDLERALLHSARADAPSPASRRKTLVVLGLAGGIGAAVTTTTAASTATTTALVKSAGTLALLKWVGAGVVCGAVTLGIVNAVSPVDDGGLTRPSGAQQALADEGGGTRPGKALPPPKPPVDDEGARPPVGDEGAKPPVGDEGARPAEVTSAAPIAAEAAPAASGPAPAVVKPAPTSLAEEVAALDGAREALVGGDAARALRALDDHDRRFSRGALGPEATVLRIEALVQRGDRAAATRLGTAFLAAHPRSPLAARLRTLLGLPAPSSAAP